MLSHILRKVHNGCRKPHCAVCQAEGAHPADRVPRTPGNGTPWRSLVFFLFHESFELRDEPNETAYWGDKPLRRNTSG